MVAPFSAVAPLGKSCFGDGTTTERLTPVPVSGLSSVTAAAARYYYTVVLKSDGTVWAWGYNGSGQLGDGTFANQLTPVPVSGLSSVTAAAAGYYHTVALKSDGTVWAWGLNQFGQLGDGTTTSQSMPVQTSGLSLFSACGSMAVCNAGTGACVVSPLANGTVCNDGNACTQTDTCQSGTCAGASPVTCAMPDQCHDAGTCSPATGLCSTPAKPDSSLCNDSNPCTQTDLCQAGTCIGSNPLVCAALGLCHDPSTCDPQSGTCSTPPKPSGTLCGPALCSGSTLNASQVCDGNGACQPGQPQDCAPFACAAAACTTSCSLPGDCAQGATCVAGSCTFDGDSDGYLNGNDTCLLDVDPLQTDTDKDGVGDVCDSDADNDGYLNLADNCPLAATADQKDTNNDGIGDACDCANPMKADGTTCDDGDACTQTDACQGGTCTGSNVLVCPPLGECQVGLCNPANGVCLPVHKHDNTPCMGGVCIAGGCYIEGAPSSASASASSSGVGGSSSSSASGSGGTTVASTSSAATTSATTGTGAGTGTGGSAGEITLHGGACGIPAGAPSPRAAWLGALALLALARRRARISRPDARR